MLYLKNCKIFNDFWQFPNSVLSFSVAMLFSLDPLLLQYVQKQKNK